MRTMVIIGWLVVTANLMAKANLGIKGKDFSVDDCLDTERSNIPEFANHSTLIIGESKDVNLMGVILRKILDSKVIGVGELVVLDGLFDDQELRVRKIFNVGVYDKKRTILIKATNLALTKYIQFDYIITTSEAIAISYVRKFFPINYIEPNIAAIKRTLKLNYEVYINTRYRYIGDLWSLKQL